MLRKNVSTKISHRRDVFNLTLCPPKKVRRNMANSKITKFQPSRRRDVSFGNAASSICEDYDTEITARIDIIGSLVTTSGRVWHVQKSDKKPLHNRRIISNNIICR